jgi:hypothetical protein
VETQAASDQSAAPQGPAARPYCGSGRRSNTRAVIGVGSLAGTPTSALRKWVVTAPTHGPNGGVADSLDKAKAAFRAAGGRNRNEFGPTTAPCQRARRWLSARVFSQGNDFPPPPPTLPAEAFTRRNAFARLGSSLRPSGVPGRRGSRMDNPLSSERAGLKD